MKLLDLYCGVGGASVGYARAGFDVIGVDIEPQPDYPFPFVQADALEFLTYADPSAFALIHASPPCQAYLSITTVVGRGRVHPRLTEPTRELLLATGLPFVIENPAARPDVVLCGEMFDLSVIRHRRFELEGWSMLQPVHRPHRGRVQGWRHGEYFDGPYRAVYGHGGGQGATVADWQEAMGIGWTDVRKSIAEAIPPAFTECIGSGFLVATALETAA